MAQAQKTDTDFMTKLSTFIMDKRNLFFHYHRDADFSTFSRNWVNVENSLISYLPDDAETKQALDLMEEQFTTYGMAEALSGRLSDVKGVQIVSFDQTTDHYAKSSALFSVTFDCNETDDWCPDSLEGVKTLPADYDLYIPPAWETP